MSPKKGSKCYKFASKHVANSVSPQVIYSSQASISQGCSEFKNADTGNSAKILKFIIVFIMLFFNTYWYNKYVVVENNSHIYFLSSLVGMALSLDACVKTRCRHECATKIITKHGICVLCQMDVIAAHKLSGFYDSTINYSNLRQCLNTVCGPQCFSCVPRVCTDTILSCLPSACRLFSRQNKNSTRVYRLVTTDTISGNSGCTRVFYHAGLGQGHTRLVSHRLYSRRPPSVQSK